MYLQSNSTQAALAAHIVLIEKTPILPESDIEFPCDVLEITLGSPLCTTLNVAYSWTDEEGVIIGTASSLTIADPSAPTTYTVSYTIEPWLDPSGIAYTMLSNNCSTALMSESITISPSNCCAASWAAPEPFCNNEGIQLDVLSSSELLASDETATWEGMGVVHDGSGIADFNPSNLSGNVLVTLTVEDSNGCSDSQSHFIEVFASPIFDLDEGSSDCVNSVIDAGAGFATYLWSNGESTQSITVTASDNYGVSVTDANGCVVSDVIAVTIYPLPNATFTGLDSFNPYCSTGELVTLTPNTPGGTFTGEGVVGNTFDPSLVTISGGLGQATITYTITENGCTNSSAQPVVVLSTQDASFSDLAPIYCSTDDIVALVPTEDGGTFTGEGVTGTQFDPSVVTLDTPIDISYTLADPCGDMTTQSVIVSETGSCCLTPPQIGEIDTPDELACCLTFSALLYPSDDTDIIQYTVGDGGTTPAEPEPNSWDWSDLVTDLNALDGIDLTLGDSPQINGDFIVPSGITLTITGRTMRFGPNGRILVQNNGRLNLVNTTLNNLCNTVWQGIQVEGPGLGVARATDGSNYGIVDINGGQILNAIMGVSAMQFDLIDVDELATVIIPAFNLNNLNGALTNLSSLFLFNDLSPFLSSVGGVCRTTNNVRFINCFIGIVLPHYANSPGAIGDVTDIKGAQFSNVSDLVYPFTSPTLPDVMFTEAGIHCIQYQYLSIGGPNPGEANTFNDIKYGVRGMGLNSSVISDNAFNNCDAGVSILNRGNVWTDNFVGVAANTFDHCRVGIQAGGADIQIHANMIHDSEEIGVFLRGCDFDMGSLNIISNTVFGTVLLTNTLESIIDGNQYNACGIPVWSVGDNTGVQIKCNQLNNYVIGIVLTDYVVGGVNLQSSNFSSQGDCDPLGIPPANNQFNNTLTVALDEILSTAAMPVMFQYNYSNDPAFVPVVTSTSIIPNLCPPGTDNQCDVDFPMEVSDILALTDERRMNEETMKKVIYFVNEQNEMDSALVLLNDVNTKMANRILATHYIYTGEYGLAQQKIDALPEDDTDDLHFKQLNTLYKNLAIEGRTVFQITSTEETTIRNIALSQTKTAYDAQALLYELYGEEYPTELPDWPSFLTQNSSTMINLKTAVSVTEGYHFSPVYPNPATQTAYIDYQIPEEETATINIYDIYGRLLSSKTLEGKGTFNMLLEKDTQGLLLYIIDGKNGILEKGKFSLIK